MDSFESTSEAHRMPEHKPASMFTMEFNSSSEAKLALRNTS